MGWMGKIQKKKSCKPKCPQKKILQAETEEKKILAEGNLPFKVNFLQNALKQRFWGSENLIFPGERAPGAPSFSYVWTSPTL